MNVRHFPQLNSVDATPARSALGPDGRDREHVTAALKIAGGSSRTVQWQVSFDGGVVWLNAGTTRTTTGDFIELIPRAPLYRVNCTANVGGSTVDAYIAC